jgi:outer membrane immunogenic protein
VAFWQHYCAIIPLELLIVLRAQTRATRGTALVQGSGMKRIFVVGALLFASVEVVLAADIATPPPPAPPSSYFPTAAPINWGGFYIGVNSGYGFGTSNWTATAASSAAGGTTGSFNTSGLLVGGTLGLNLQAGAVLFGVETDGGWTNLNGSSSNSYCSSVTANATCETKSDWLSTARIRIGYAFNQILVYGTGGIAVGDVQSGLNPPATFDSSINVGWTAGAGIEYAFAQNWSAKIEYLYINLGASCTSANCGPAVPFTVPLTENVVRAGVNFKFGPW